MRYDNFNYPPQNDQMSPSQNYVDNKFHIIVLFPRWDMLVPWRVSTNLNAIKTPQAHVLSARRPSKRSVARKDAWPIRRPSLRQNR